MTILGKKVFDNKNLSHHWSILKFQCNWNRMKKDLDQKPNQVQMVLSDLQ